MGNDGGCGSEGGGSDGEVDEDDDDNENDGGRCKDGQNRGLSDEQSKHSKKMSSIEKLEDTPMFSKKLPPPDLRMHPPSADDSGGSEDEEEGEESGAEDGREGAAGGTAAFASKSKGTSKLLGGIDAGGTASKGGLHSPIGSTHSFDLQVGFKSL